MNPDTCNIQCDPESAEPYRPAVRVVAERYDSVINTMWWIDCFDLFGLHKVPLSIFLFPARICNDDTHASEPLHKRGSY